MQREKERKEREHIQNQKAFIPTRDGINVGIKTASRDTGTLFFVSRLPVWVWFCIPLEPENGSEKSLDIFCTPE